MQWYFKQSVNFIIMHQVKNMSNVYLVDDISNLWQLVCATILGPILEKNVKALYYWPFVRGTHQFLSESLNALVVQFPWYICLHSYPFTPTIWNIKLDIFIKVFSQWLKLKTWWIELALCKSSVNTITFTFWNKLDFCLKLWCCKPLILHWNFPWNSLHDIGLWDTLCFSCNAKMYSTALPEWPLALKWYI